jgi:putative ATP-binding cassette transporter
MTDHSTEIAGTVADGEAANSALMRQLGMMTRAIFASPVGKTLAMLLAAIVIVIVATAYGQIRIN